MPKDSPPDENSLFLLYFWWWESCFLVVLWLCYSLVWGIIICEMVDEFFVRVLRSSDNLGFNLCKMIQTGFACVAMSPLLQFMFCSTITVIGLTMQFLTSISLVVSVVVS